MPRPPSQLSVPRNDHVHPRLLEQSTRRQSRAETDPDGVTTGRLTSCFWTFVHETVAKCDAKSNRNPRKSPNEETRSCYLFGRPESHCRLYRRPERHARAAAQPTIALDGCPVLTIIPNLAPRGGV